MANNVLAVYPGTFDPITLGHEDVVRRATQLFGQVIVAVAAGHHKKTLFSLEERIEMVREATRQYPQVQVESFSGLLRDFVVARGGKAMVRGLRAVTDFDYAKIRNQSGEWIVSDLWSRRRDSSDERGFAG